MALPTSADVDAAVAASGSPRPKTALMNALLKNLLAYVATLGGGGGGAWGTITGTLSSQTDLAAALGGKSNTGHTHVPSDVTGLGTAATRNVAASGDATGTGSPARVVPATDTRLTNARTPAAHTHPQTDVSNLTADLAVAKRDPVQIIIDSPAVDTIPLEESAL